MIFFFFTFEIFRYFGVGDTIGVLLDMDHGTVSFFKDGEDIGGSNPGRSTVVNMGVAYKGLRRNARNSASFVPCFGVKQAGDRLTLRSNTFFFFPMTFAFFKSCFRFCV